MERVDLGPVFDIDVCHFHQKHSILIATPRQNKTIQMRHAELFRRFIRFAQPFEQNEHVVLLEQHRCVADIKHVVFARASQEVDGGHLFVYYAGDVCIHKPLVILASELPSTVHQRA